jgi:mono/diheme cytochrome c family protein
MFSRFVFNRFAAFVSVLAVFALGVLFAHGTFTPPARPALAGGWAVVTLDALPERVIAGEPVTVGFVVRQHGVSVLEGLSPAPHMTLTQLSGTDPFEVEAIEDTPGHYTADLLFPDAGEWAWMINAFGPDQPLPTLTVLPARTPEDQIAYGAALFVAKGCAVCHAHSRADFDPFSTINSGPDLGPYTSDPDFLRAWLHDPSAVEPNTAMPTLGLDDAEIEALIAFLLAE